MNEIKGKFSLIFTKFLSLFFLKYILILNNIKLCSFMECERDKPFLKENTCISSCKTEEISKGICIINNDIIKTQWLNNIIIIGGKEYIYINVESSEANNLYYLSSSFPASNVRKFYILNNEGFGLFDKNNPFITLIVDDPENKGRFESDILLIKLFSSNDNKEYLINLSLGIQNAELYDFYNKNIYFNIMEKTFGQTNINTLIGTHFKLKLSSEQNQNIYLIGILAHKYPTSAGEPNLFLKKVNFYSLDISNNNNFSFETQSIKCSKTRMISCYETSKNFIVCFLKNEDNEYRIIIYNYNLELKINYNLSMETSNVKEEQIFFKCIHFFEETGAFGFYSNDANPLIVFQFKRYLYESNSIIDHFKQIKIDNYYFSKELLSLNDMIKIEDKKFCFVGVSINKDIFYIISLYNYYEDNFEIKIYSINTQNLYNFIFSRVLKLTIYNNFLVLGAYNSIESKGNGYSSLIIFSYPNTTDVNLELSDYLFKNNKMKIYNLTFELNAKLTIENNIFGYTYSGIKIIENCKGLKNIYLSSLDNKKINDDYFLPKGKYIKLIIPKSDIYSPFTCQLKYASVLSEPDFEEFQKYPIEILDNGNYENYFRKNYYIGRYSLYKIYLENKLTQIDCDDNCELCYFNDKRKCLSCHYINNENKECLASCNSSNFFNKKCEINNNNEYVKDDMIENIKNGIESGEMSSLIEKNLIKGDKKDILVSDKDTIYQITTTTNQNNNKYNNMSSILLGEECENILKIKYNINKNLPLIILKIDYFKKGSLIPIVGYEVFNPENMSKLDLSFCEDKQININIPVSIDENNLFKYDPKNEYYIDECIPYTTEEGTDILLNDRHYEYNDNNLSLCENNCIFKGYETDSKNSKCECNIKKQQIVISEVINQYDILYNNFINQTLVSNLVSMKCFNTLFSKEGLYKNIGSYILFFTIIIFISSGFLFYKCGYPLIELDIQQILEFKEDKVNKPHKIKRKSKKLKTEKINKINKDISHDNNVSNINSNSHMNKTISRVHLKSNNNIFIYNNKKKEDKHNNKHLNDYHLNHFKYIVALKKDKRNLISYYASLIKTKHPLIFSFVPIKDYNSIIVKINLFFLTFSIYNFINALFFNESTIHKIYKDNGKFNPNYLVPQSIYSFIITHIVLSVIKYFVLTDKDVYEIEIQKTEIKALEKVDKVKKKIIIKNICFFTIGSAFLLFLWYYLSSFGSVYQNTQYYLIKNALISFGVSVIYPFIINLFPALLRIYSLKKSNRKCIYKISKILQFI